MIENAPEDIVVTVECLGAGVAEVGEAGGSGGDCGLELGAGGVCVAEADFEAEVACVLDGFGGGVAFRGEGEEDAVVLGDVADFVE
ncbi:MAG: hypothetical protein RI897_3121 [Verrucomicrobiota bacterium]